MRRQEMPTMLTKGMQIYLKVEGNKLYIQSETGQAALIESIVLTRAICENYLGAKPVSPTAKKAIFKAMEKLVGSN
jgi:hypothetical protein